MQVQERECSGRGCGQSDLKYNSDLYHIHKFSDNTDRRRSIGQLIGAFVAWCRSNSLQLNTIQTKEIVVNFHRNRLHLQPLSGAG